MKFETAYFWRQTNVSRLRTINEVTTATMADLKTKKVIVIGAGASGIAAATRLIENGVKNVQILEAEHRIGGRINTIPFGDNVVDLGAHMCHGQKDNVVWSLAKDHNLLEPLSVQNDQVVLTSSNGAPVPKEISDKLFGLAGKLSSAAEKESFVGSVGNFWMEKYRQEIKQKEFRDIDEELLKDFPKVFEHHQNIQKAFASWHDGSGRSLSTFKPCEGEQTLSWKCKGYVTVFDLLQKKIPASNSNQIDISNFVKFGKEVKKIDYRAKNAPVRIACIDGSVYEADHVICTVSLGVLKANHLSIFDPFLPWEKVNSIEGMGFGAIGIVNVEFDRTFWPKGWTGLFSRWLLDELREIRSSEETRWLEDVFAILPIDYQSKSLIAWVSGPRISEMEKLPEDVVGRAITKMLKFFAPSLNVPEKPINTKRSSWRTNPHFKGTVSFYSLESDAVNATNEALAVPIVDANGFPRLQFAGEHTNTNQHYATVHGAIETGWREADCLLNAYLNDN